MKIYRQWKEFLEWRRFLDVYQEIELNRSEKSKLEALDNDLMEKVFMKVKNNIANRVVSEDASVDYVKWAKYTLANMKNIFRK